MLSAARIMQMLRAPFILDPSVCAERQATIAQNRNQTIDFVVTTSYFAATIERRKVQPCGDFISATKSHALVTSRL
jgi:hypothetical protein